LCAEVSQHDIARFFHFLENDAARLRHRSPNLHDFNLFGHLWRSRQFEWLRPSPTLPSVPEGKCQERQQDRGGQGNKDGLAEAYLAHDLQDQLGE
jgi:hypothetical protein